MFHPLLVSAAITLLLMSGATESSESSDARLLDLEPAVNGAVSANGLFPAQAMEEAFTAYLRWAKEQGWSRLVAFESLINDDATAGGRLPSQRMQDQFSTYMRWVDDQGLSPFYAFTATNFD
jgi:hypothetical protein